MFLAEDDFGVPGRALEILRDLEKSLRARPKTWIGHCCFAKA
jgi:hypothetical protein